MKRVPSFALSEISVHITGWKRAASQIRPPFRMLADKSIVQAGRKYNDFMLFPAI